VLNPARAGLFGWLLRYYVFAIACVVVAAVVVGHRVYRSYAAELPDLGQVEQYDTIAPGVTGSTPPTAACSPSSPASTAPTRRSMPSRAI
jgi:hypothetical protein